MMRRCAALALLGTLAACANSPMATTMTADAVSWRALATPDDRQRLAGWRTAWIAALEKTRHAGFDAAIEADAALYAYDRALADPLPPAGDYRCRVVKLGGKAAGMLDYVAYPDFTCRVTRDGAAWRFTKLSGSQRPIGWLYTAETDRAAFLGTLQLGDETAVIDYGRDRDRDVAGWMERIDAARWRLSFPYPHFESTLDVIELTPVR